MNISLRFAGVHILSPAKVQELNAVRDKFYDNYDGLARSYRPQPVTDFLSNLTHDRAFEDSRFGNQGRDNPEPVDLSDGRVVYFTNTGRWGDTYRFQELCSKELKKLGSFDEREAARKTIRENAALQIIREAGSRAKNY